MRHTLYSIVFTVVTLLAWASAAQAAPVSKAPRIIMSTQSAEQCATLGAALQLESREPLTLECVVLRGSESEQGLRLQSLKSQKQFKYHLHWDARDASQWIVTIENWIQSDDTEFETISWKIDRSKGESAQLAALQLRLKHFLQSHRNLRFYREVFLARGAAYSKQIELDREGLYRDRLTREPLEFEVAYSRFASESEKQKSFLRSSSEVLFVLTAGALNYWLTPGIQDIEYDYTAWQSIRTRFTGFELHRLDDNAFSTNYLSHPLAGWLYYALPRTNGYNSLESLLFSFTASAFWEYALEFREIISLNDLVITPFAGAAIGEVFHQFTRHFTNRAHTSSGAGKVINQTLSYVFGAPQKFDGWIRKQAIRSNPLAGMDGGPDAFAQFSIFGALASRENSAGLSLTDGELGFEGELIRIPGYGVPGEVRKVVSNGPWSRLRFSTTMGEEGYHDLMLSISAALTAYSRQNLKMSKAGGKDAKGSLEGYSLLLGVGPGFELEDIDRPGLRTTFGIVKVLGGMLDLNVYTKGYHVRVVMDVFGEMAQIRTLALEDYVAQGGTLEGDKAILGWRQQYHALGASAETQLTIRKGAIEIGGRVSGALYDSIEGADREQRHLTKDSNLKDRRTISQVWVGAYLPRSSIKVEVGAERRNYLSQWEAVQTKKSQTTYFGRVRVFF